MCVYVYIYICVCIYIYTHIYIHIYIYIYVCIYIYIHTYKYIDVVKGGSSVVIQGAASCVPPRHSCDDVIGQSEREDQSVCSLLHG